MEREISAMISNEQVYTVKDIMIILKIGRKKAYELVKENHFRYKKIGTNIRIVKEFFDEWLSN
ncbi:MAG: helix-turn-helix domain-containing protein [Breznakia sp.]